MALTYSKVSVPEPLMRRVQRLVEAHPEEGYRSASDVATDLLRQWAESRERQSRNDDAEDLRKHVADLDRIASEREKRR